MNNGESLPSGEIIAIYTTSAISAPMRSVTNVHAVPGRGLEGDRKYNKGEMAAHGSKAAGVQLTLIESEAIEALTRETAIEFQHSESRRNLITRGVALNHLVGKEFNIGEVRVLGIRLCEPCEHLEKLTRPGVLKGLIHRGGLRGQILTEGTIRVGDAITFVKAARSQAACV